ncbi:hypothetical protein CAEBREN_17584 [Caenorhabditis brenneri]|uniref:Uncharacterized protein n=1 Tax=Caenorhabditis brenneri TaxID=135651 RepID=G0MBL7_CAEBE|nr:hypothetical protein CAEBREN_17584 [Caenorhabditis brenneri]
MVSPSEISMFGPIAKDQNRTEDKSQTEIYMFLCKFGSRNTKCSVKSISEVSEACDVHQQRFETSTVSTTPLSSGSLDEGVSWLRAHCQISSISCRHQRQEEDQSSTSFGTVCCSRSVCQNPFHPSYPKLVPL